MKTSIVVTLLIILTTYWIFLAVVVFRFQRQLCAEREARRKLTAALNSRSVGPIDYDPQMDRYYIPLPGGWKVQTKGKGNTFRIARTNGDTGRTSVPVIEAHLHKHLEQLARDVHAAWTKVTP